MTVSLPAKRLIATVCLSLVAGIAASPCLAREKRDEFIRVSPDGWHFETARTHKPFVPFGGVYFDPATYTDKPFPRFLVIERFDEQRTDRHFAQIAGIGGNLVRISTSVKTFSPQYKKMDYKAFEKLDRIIALAKKHGLRVTLDPFGGWEGMPDWIPWWPAALVDEKMLQGMEFLFSEFAQRYRNEPAVFSYLIADEPSFLWTFHGMPSGFGNYVRTLYGDEENLKCHWADYPRKGERWDRIIPPRDEIRPGSRRLYDYQTFREDITTRFVERMAGAIRSKDSRHMISLGNIQWVAPLRYVIDAAPFNDLVKPSGYFPFNPQKIGKFLDYLDIHSYNWWDGKEAEFTQAMGRYTCYPGKPVILGEFSFDAKVVEYTSGSFSGYSAWAFFAQPNEPVQHYLFDGEGKLTDHGKAFAETAAKIAGGQIVLNRAEDAATVEADGVASLSDLRSTMDVYERYMDSCRGAHPVGLRSTKP